MAGWGLQGTCQHILPHEPYVLCHNCQKRFGAGRMVCGCGLARSIRRQECVSFNCTDMPRVKEKKKYRGKSEAGSHMPPRLRLIIKTPSQLKRLNATQIKWQLKASYTLSLLSPGLSRVEAGHQHSLPAGRCHSGWHLLGGCGVPPRRPELARQGRPPRAEPAVTAGLGSRYLGHRDRQDSFPEWQLLGPGVTK